MEKNSQLAKLVNLGEKANLHIDSAYYCNNIKFNINFGFLFQSNPTNTNKLYV